MSKNIKKIIKLIYIIFIIFLIINIFTNTSVYASGSGTAPTTSTSGGTGGATGSTSNSIDPFWATIAKSVIAFSQVLVAGCFTIRFTMLGIQYFTAVGADVKAANKQRMVWTLLIGVLTFFGIFIFGKYIETL